MIKLDFSSDYMEGAHPLIFERLLKINDEKIPGYGKDKYTNDAKEKILNECGMEKGEVFFLAGGTQTNAVVISALLKFSEAVIGADTAHIATHEAGAIEKTGHKVLTVPQKDGKIVLSKLTAYLDTYFSDENFEHTPLPAVLYISFPTEYGTIYTKDEISCLREICDKYSLKLYIDGARMGYGLAARGADITLKDIASLSDVFYIGGTKVGALFGEAVVFKDRELMPRFFTHIKSEGALLAKGWIPAVMFDVLFTDGLYYKISQNAVDCAMKIKEMLINKGYKIYIDSPTNQQFAVIENKKLSELKKNVGVGFWEKYDENHTVIRIASSWATTFEQVKALEKYL